MNISPDLLERCLSLLNRWSSAVETDEDLTIGEQFVVARTDDYMWPLVDSTAELKLELQTLLANDKGNENRPGHAGGQHGVVAASEDQAAH